MKKVVLLLAIMSTAFCAFSQTRTSKIKYRVGITTPLPLDVYGDQPVVNLGSTLVEANCELSKALTLTLNSGYTRITENGRTFSQIPVLLGLRHPLNESFYFGGAAGMSIYTKKGEGDTEVTFSPYVGYQVKHLSVDFRYLNNLRKEGSLRTIALTISYTL